MIDEKIISRLLLFIRENAGYSMHLVVALNILFLLVIALFLLGLLYGFWHFFIFFSFVLTLNIIVFVLVLDGKIEFNKPPKIIFSKITTLVQFLNKIKLIPKILLYQIKGEKFQEIANVWLKNVLILFLLVMIIGLFLQKAIVIYFISEFFLITLIIGVILFCLNRKIVSKKFMTEKSIEEKEEGERKKEFEINFKNVDTIPGLGKLIKFFYKEGWIYLTILLIIVFIGFVFRIWNLNYLQGADNFNLIAAKALNETGSFLYNRNLHITYVLAFLFHFFGASWIVARIPFVAVGTFSIFLVYFLGKFINKKVGLISAFLLAISPIAIEQSTIIREYSEDFLLVLAVTILLWHIYWKYCDSLNQFIKKYFLIATTLLVLVYTYCKLVANESGVITLAAIVFMSLPIAFMVIKDKARKLLPFFLYIAFQVVLLLLLFLHYSQDNFHTWGYETYWFKMFFDPMVKYPMQWFSFSPIGTIAVFALFLIPLIYRNRAVLISYFTFFSFVLLFIFKFNNQFNFTPTRYLYPIYSFYILIFAVSIYFLVRISEVYKFKKVVMVFVLLFIFFTFIIIQNSVLAANHNLNIYFGDARQPTVTGNANYFLDVIAFLKDNNLKDDSAVLVQAEHPFFITWYFNRPITRTYKNIYSDEYQIGEKTYFVSKPWGVNEFDVALNENDNGYFISSSGEYPQKNFEYNGFEFVYLGEVKRHRLYYWSKKVILTA